MKFWIRQIFVTAVALIVMAVCGLAAFLWSFDPNSYKNALQVLVQQRLDRQLTIQGDLKVVFFPDIAIQAKQVSLSERASTDVFASVEDLRATIAILPLLKNHLLIEEISLGGLKAQVQRSQLGNFLLDDLLGWGHPTAPVAQADDVGLLMDDISIDIAEILIKKSEFTVLDAARKATWKLHDASLEFGRIKKGEPFKAELNARIQHADSQAVAKLSAQATLNVDLASRGITAKNFSASFKGDLPENIWFEETLKKVDLTLAMPYVMVEPASGRLRLERLTLRSKGLRDGAPFEYSVDAPLFDISNTFARGESVASRLRMDGSPAIDARIVLDGLEGNRNKLLFERTSLDLAVKRDVRVFKLGLSAPIEIEPFTTTLTMKSFQGEIQTIQAPVSKTVQSTPVNGNFSVAFNSQKRQLQPLHISAHADNVPFKTLLSGLGIDSVLDGTASIDFRAGFIAGPMTQVKQSLSGTVKMRLDHAALEGANLATGLDALRSAAVADKQSAHFIFDRSESTLFDTVELEVKMDGGLAHVTRLNMVAPSLTIREGKPAMINLGNDTLDMAASVHFLGLQSLTTKRVTLQVRSLTVPLRLTGSIMQPEVSIQWAALDRDSNGRLLREKLLSPSNQGIQKK